MENGLIINESIYAILPLKFYVAFGILNFAYSLKLPNSKLGVSC